jgi:branched-chain amino acid transport system permease protein
MSRLAWRARGLSTLLLLCIIVAIAALPGVFGSAVTEIAVTEMFINMMVAVALHVFIGNSGVFSFGHFAFVAIGAYTVGIVRILPRTKSVLFPELPAVQLNSFTAILLGAAMAAVVAAVIGAPLMRLSGLVAGLATFALLNITFIVASNLEAFTGGSTGLSGIPRTITPTSAAMWTMFTLAVAWSFNRSRLALTLRASREDDVAARSLGIGITKERTAAFIVSAFIAGIAGGVLAEFFGAFTPQQFYLSATFIVVAMLVVGGTLSLTGAVFGAIFITLAGEVLRRVEAGIDVGPFTLTSPEGLQQFAVAAIMLTVLVFFPNGLTKGREWSLSGLSRRLARRREL